MVKYNIGLKTLLQQGISEPIFYGDLVYKFNELLENRILVFNSKNIKRYITVGYNLDVMRQSACLVLLNPITVYSYVVRYNCTTMSQASDFMTALT